MLDDLLCPAGKGLEPCLELLVLPLHFDGLEMLPLKLVISSVSRDSVFLFLSDSEFTEQ